MRGGISALTPRGPELSLVCTCMKNPGQGLCFQKTIAFKQQIFQSRNGSIFSTVPKLQISLKGFCLLLLINRILYVKKVYPDLKIITPWAAHIGIGFLDWGWDQSNSRKQTTRKVH